MKFIKVLLASLLLASLPLSAMLTGCKAESEPGTSKIDWSNHRECASQFVMALVAGDYTIAAEGFNDEMKEAMSVVRLRQTWEDIIAEAGAFEEIVSVNQVPNAEYDIFEIVTKHENTGLNSRLVLTDDDQVAGLFFSFVDLGMEEPYRGSEPQQRDGYTDFPVTVGEGSDYPLPGLLSIPDNAEGPLTAVVLVHGSGPQNMDEALYGIAPFRDIADYLASNGIAVLRYDKRTYVHATTLTIQYGDDLTVYEETIQDALRALDLLASDERIDAGRIFVIGHSMGGMLLPRIMGESDGGFAGGIIMAGSPRSMLELIYDQNQYLLDITEMSDAERAAMVEQIDAARDNYFYLSEHYFTEMDSHPAADYLQQIDKPILIMQGGKDFQVYADKDYVLYQEIAAGRSNFEFRLYDNLTHMFTQSSMDKPSVADYVSGAKVDGQPLADMLAWLQAH